MPYELPASLRLECCDGLSTDPNVLRRAYAEAEASARSNRPTKRPREDDDPDQDDQVAAQLALWAAASRLQTPNPPRPVYVAQDYVVSGKTVQDANAILRRFPALQQRNSYVVQNHAATQHHHDLRIHLDGVTLSFVIPKHVDALAQNLQQCQAFETPAHPLNYSIFEGNARGTTAVWDIGTYRVLRTRAEQRKLDESSDEEESELEDEDDDHDGHLANKASWPEDVRQEHLLSEKYHRAAFLDRPARLGRRTRKADPDRGRMRAFVIELNGIRYTGLELRFSRDSSSRHLGYAAASPAEGMKRKWLIVNHDPTKRNVENRSIGPKSVLSHRTMDEIARSPVVYGEDDGDVRELFQPMPSSHYQH